MIFLFLRGYGMTTMTQDFDFVTELNKEMMRNLTTSFGLDYAMITDRRGGNVDTIHKVREYQKEGPNSDIHIDATNDKAYQNRGNYDSHAYHKDQNYIKKGREDKQLHREGHLQDAYLNKKFEGDRQLDHTISAKEIHDDRARSLTGLDGVSLANANSNLNSTNWYVNNLKRAHSMDHFLSDVVPKKQNELKQTILKNEKKHKEMPLNTPKQRHEAQKVQDRIKADKEKLGTLNQVEKNADKMRDADATARKEYDKKISVDYYTSTQFLKSAASDMANTGFKMGMRQVIGLVLAEVWLELKDFLSSLFNKGKNHFNLNQIWSDIKEAISNIFNRVKEKLKAILASFKDGAIGGIFSSITNIFLNVFTVASKSIGKIIREMWQTLVSVIKMIFFNPDKLSLSELMRNAIKLLALGAATVLGTLLDSYLTSVFTFPFGSAIASFISALCTGLLTVTLVYFIDHSSVMRRIWDFLDKIKSEAQRTLEYFKKVNAQLDQYLMMLAQVEFNMDPKELMEFADSLEATTCEYERGYILNAEIERRNIELPFEAGNTASVRNWLKSLGK